MAKLMWERKGVSHRPHKSKSKSLRYVGDFNNRRLQRLVHVQGEVVAFLLRVHKAELRWIKSELRWIKNGVECLEWVERGELELLHNCIDFHGDPTRNAVSIRF